MQTGRKSSISGARNGYETSIEDKDNKDTAQKSKGLVLRFFDGNRSAGIDFPENDILQQN